MKGMNMKKLLVLAIAAAASHAAMADTQKVWFGFFLGDWPQGNGSAVGYVNPYEPLLDDSCPDASGDVEQVFSLTNTPPGWKFGAWLSNDVDTSWEARKFTTLSHSDPNSLPYKWHTRTDSRRDRNLAVRFDLITNVWFKLDTAGGTYGKNTAFDFEDDAAASNALKIVGGYAHIEVSAATNRVVVPKYKGTRKGYSPKGWAGENGRYQAETFSASKKRMYNNPTKLDPNSSPKGLNYQSGYDMCLCDRYQLSDNTTNTLTLVWTANVYRVDFNLNDGSAPTMSKYVTYASTYGELPTPERPGYAFTGWFTSRTGSTRVEDSTPVTSTNLVQDLYAHWDAYSYTLTKAVSPSGTGSVTASPNKSTYHYGTNVTLTATADKGYLFSRWQDGPTDNPRTVTVTSNATYTAVFTQAVYTVWLVTNSKTNETPKIVTYGSPYGSLYTPVRTGSTFQGWYTELSGGSKVTESTIVKKTESHALYSRWSANSYNITTAVEGSGSVSPSGTHAYTYQTSVELTATPSEAGWLFKDWKEDGLTETSRVVTVTGDATYTAVFTQIVHRVRFSYYDSNAAVGVVTQYVSHGEAAVPPGLDVVDRCPGRKWTGWGADYGSIISNIVIASYYDQNKYYVAFNPNCENPGGSMSKLYLKCYQPYNLTSNGFSRVGYVFDRWNTMADGSGGSYADGEKVTGLSYEDGVTVTLYAQWKPITYYIAFSGGEGSEGYMEPIAASYDAAVVLTSNSLTKTDHVFKHWTFGGDDYADGATVSNLTATAGETVTLVAVWETALTRAMHCTTLEWSGVVMTPLQGNNMWIAREGEGLGYNGSGSCAEQTGVAGNALTAAVTTNGTLTFMCRNASAVDDALLDMSVNRRIDALLDKGEQLQAVATLPANSGWRQITVNIAPSEHPGTGNLYIKFTVRTGSAVIQIDQMVWSPGEASNPEPTEADRVEPSAVSVDGDGMSISFTGDARFAYHLIATDSLAPTNWYDFGGTNVGADALQSFEIPIEEGQPQRFFKIKVIQKK